MNKKGTLVILNDLKNEREMIKKKYTEQKNKRFSDKQTLLYVAGFWLIFAGACLVCPTNMLASSLSLISYGLGVTCTYCYYYVILLLFSYSYIYSYYLTNISISNYFYYYNIIYERVH